jgi:8-oxo-dGTP pyrophosphatase MutT (NUDIX family)
MSPPPGPGHHAVVRTAATVIVLDTIAGEPSALMVRRNPALRFFGGYWVFPGGAIDAADGLADSDVIRAAAVAGARELSEEASLALEPTRLVHWGRWITPSSEPKRFDTHFFVAAAEPHQQPSIVAGEIVAWKWLPLAHWPKLTEGGGFPVPMPTQVVLREVAEALAHHGSMGELLARERGRSIHPVMPKMTTNDEVVLPWDPEYAALPGDGLEWNTEAIGTRQTWPSRFR